MLPPPLVALTPGDLEHGGSARALETLRAAIGAGLTGVLVREPGLADRALLELALAVRAELEGVSGGEPWLGLHDRAHLARAARADAVHLGFRSLAPDELPAALRAGLSVGLSTHAGDDERRWCTADYLFHGPLCDTPSKRGRIDPVGLDGLCAACARSARPIWALGGVGPEHARDALRAGASGVAVLGGVFRAPDPARAVRAYLEALDGAEADR